jgi:hypothetical protein
VVGDDADADADVHGNQGTIHSRVRAAQSATRNPQYLLLESQLRRRTRGSRRAWSSYTLH